MREIITNNHLGESGSNLIGHLVTNGSEQTGSFYMWQLATGLGEQ